MRSKLPYALALVAGLASLSAAQAQSRPYGPGFDGWTFTATVEKPGVVNCRATRKVGGREDILAMRNDMKPYLSIKGEGRRGRWPGTLVSIPGRPQYQWRVTSEANGARMWFPMPDFGTVGDIAAAGVFEFHMPDSEDTGRIPLGKRAPDAWERVNQCAVAHNR